MRHLKVGKILARTSAHRKALFNNLVTSLVQHEKIVTTLAKAKELKRKADKAITLAKRGDLNSRRGAFKTIKNKEALAKLFNTLGPRFAKRNGGYTRIYHLGSRNGDAAKMALVEWVGQEIEVKKDTKGKKTKEKTKTSPKNEPKDKKETRGIKESKAKQETKKTKASKEKQGIKKKERSPVAKSK